MELVKQEEKHMCWVEETLTPIHMSSRTIRIEAAFSMQWRELMKLMAKVYCPRNEIQKTKSELWNLAIKNNDLAAYTQRFQELTMLCTKMVPEEEDQIKTRSSMTPEAIEELVNQRVEEALVTYEEARAANAFEAKMAVMTIMEMVEMEMVKLEMVEMEIQMRIIGVIGMLLENAHTMTS
nr:reverse transcriptase domain-containing protein [Tanacetum cinerariifolium]